MKIKKDDTIRVVAGKDKGKDGKVLSTISKKQKVVIEGVNIRTRHIKKTSQQAGQIVKYPAPIHVSNVMILDPKDSKPTKIGYSIGKDRKKLRISKRSGEVLDSKSAKAKTAKKAAPKKTK
ncbi:50S ribosomal protein L24 [Candidatus Peregrinibacteria bacterium]|jgi:large subunit ribosomal protein L24|nr:50S ribosomal protein L24 [Candidatus Peregrinibacteria bacterium]